MSDDGKNIRPIDWTVPLSAVTLLFYVIWLLETRRRAAITPSYEEVREKQLTRLAAWITCFETHPWEHDRLSPAFRFFVREQNPYERDQLREELKKWRSEIVTSGVLYRNFEDLPMP